MRNPVSSEKHEQVGSWEWRRSVTNSAILVEIATDQGVTITEFGVSRPWVAVVSV